MLNFSVKESVNNWLFRAGIIILIVLILETFVFRLGNVIDHGITNFMANASGWISKEFSEKVVQSRDLGDAYIVKTDELGHYVYVGDGCNARRIVFLYLGFLLAVPFVQVKRRVFFAFIGTIGIVVFNILRIVVLFLMAAEMPKYFEFTHKYLFQTGIYVLIFWLWHIYLSKPHEE